MGIGVSIVLMAIGLILAIAVNAEISGLDIQIVGWILVAAGALGLILELLVWGPRRKSSGDEYVEQRRVRDDGPRY